MLEASVSSSPLLAGDVQDRERAQQADDLYETTGHRMNSDPSLALVAARAGTELTSASASALEDALTTPQLVHSSFTPDSTEFAHPPSLSLAAKRVIDVVGAIVLAAVLLPLMLPILVAMGISSGSILYRHRRVGQNGRIFKCYKFRTMVPNADKVLQDFLDRDPALKAEWLQDHKLRDDPRITFIGRFLRRTSLDELPQVWNVLKGEMSLVGPRPVVKEELLRYGRNVSAYLSVRPGITGLWQVSGRNDMDYRRRVAIDVYYVRNRTVLLDFYILLKTTGVVLSGSGAY